MEKKIRHVLEIYSKNIYIIIPFIILFPLFYLLYRKSLHGLIVNLYTEFDKLAFADYLMLSAFYDCSVIILSFLSLLILIFLKIPQRIKFAFSLGFLFVNLVFIILLNEFFKIYETSFQSILLPQKASAGWPELIGSIVSEFSAELSMKLATFSTLLFCVYYILYRLRKKITKSKSFSFFSVLPLILILSLIFFINPKNQLARVSQKFSHLSQKKRELNLYEFSLNPIYDILFSNYKVKKEKPVSIEEDKEFSFGLNTNSLETKNRFPKLGFIPKGKKFNVIFYFFESTSSKYLDLKFNGKHILSTWKKLMANSFFAKNHYTQFPFSSNAMFTVFTSAYDLPVKGIAVDNFPKIKLKTIAEILKQQGYRTGYIHTGNLDFTGQRDFLKDRFDTIIESRDLKKSSKYKKWLGWGMDDRSMIKPGVEFIKKNKNKPFFLVYAPSNPHHPYKIPDKKYNITGPAPVGATAKEKAWRKYIDSLYYADSVLGQIIDELESNNFMENTLLFIFADHGEAFYQHRKNYNHAFYIYEENMYLPLIIYNKKIFKETYYYKGISRHLDIVPTLLDILKLPREKEMEGISLVSAHQKQLALLHSYWGIKDHLGLRDDKWKYICRINDMYEELYNLDLDPEEKINLATKHPEIVKRYRKYILSARQYKRLFFKRIPKK